MRATRTTRGRAASRRNSRPVKRASAKRTAVKASKPARPVKAVVAPPEPVLYKLCKPGWSVIVERIPNAQGTRFVCPFCPKSHRVPGPVRGFKKMRRAPGGRLRQVKEEKREMALPLRKRAFVDCHLREKKGGLNKGNEKKRGRTWWLSAPTV